MSKTMMVLFSSDNVIFEVDEVFTMESNFDKNCVAHGFVDGGVTVRVASNILAKVIEFCNKHTETRNTDEDLKAFDSEFVKVDYTTLIDLIRAAYCLQIKSLLDLTCKTLIDMISGKTAEDILEIFNIENDLTLDEMEQARYFYPWAFK